MDWKNLEGRQGKQTPFREAFEWQMEWGNFDMNMCMLAVCPFGGAIAAIPDPNIPQYDERKESFMRIFDAYGKLLGEKKWEHSELCRLLKMGWSRDEELMCVMANGVVHRYNIRAELVNSFPTIPEMAEAEGVKEIGMCETWPDGVAVLTKGPDYRVFLVDNLHVCEPRSLFPLTIKPKIRPVSMAVIEASQEKPHVDVLIGTSDNSIVLCNEHEAQDQGLQQQPQINAPIVKMAVAPNGRWVALVTNNSILTVMATDFRKIVVTFETKKTLPTQVLWCGEDSVILHWRDKGALMKSLTVMVGPLGTQLAFFRGVTESSYVVQSPDSARAIFQSRSVLLQRVPKELEEIRKFGSVHPAAMLSSQFEDFEQDKPNSIINVLQDHAPGELPRAVHTCCDAAANEFRAPSQKELLRAAAFGKSFLGGRDAKQLGMKLVHARQRLRLLNELRRPAVGLVLTTKQYDCLSANPYGSTYTLLPDQRIITRLIGRHQHYLACKLCDHLGCSERDARELKRMILLHWATTKLIHWKHVKDGGALAKVIYKRLKGIPNISFADLAKRAASKAVDRRDVALHLLQHEHNPCKHVPLLLHLGELQMALDKAVSSSNTNLIYEVLVHIKEKHVTGDKMSEVFVRHVWSHPIATSLMSKYLESQDKRLLRKVYARGAQSNNYGRIGHYKAGSLQIKEAFRTDKMQPGQLGKALSDRKDKLQNALRLFEHGAQQLKMKDLSFYASATSNQLRLMARQQRLEEETGKKVYANISLRDTIVNLIVSKRSVEAEKLRKEFKVSDKSFWHFKVQALATAHDWVSLKALADHKKSPIGYAPFAQACIDQRNKHEAQQYISRIRDDRQRMSMYSDLPDLVAAAKIAARLKDYNACVGLLNRCDRGGEEYIFIRDKIHDTFGS